MNKIDTFLLIAVIIICTAVISSSVTLLQQTCPGDKEYTLATLPSNPAEKAQFCGGLCPVPEVVTEYVPQYITVNKECIEDCSDEVSQAIQNCIGGYEQFMPIN